MSLGIILTSISSLSLALTVITDKLLLGDFYHGDPTKAWFISSFIGAILGLLATGLAWCFFAAGGLDSVLLTFVTQEIEFLLAVTFCGILVSLNLRLYFSLMSEDSISTSVAIFISATPIFIYLTQVFLHGELLTTQHVLSVLITVAGLIGFEFFANYKKAIPSAKKSLILFTFIILSTAYVVLLDELFPIIERQLGVSALQSSLVAMPFFWVGFAFGTISVIRKSVRSFIKTVFSSKKYLAIIITLEFIGASFYFFEFFGLSELNATLLALIIGAHIVFVWLADIYIKSKYKKSMSGGNESTPIFIFNLQNSKLTAYGFEKKTLFFQGSFILLTIAGLAMWP